MTTAQKVAYIDSSQLIEQSKPAIAAREKFTKESDEWKKNVKTLEDALTKMNQEIMTDNNKWSAPVRKQKLAEFDNKQKEYNRYTRAIQEKAAKREKELMQPVFDALNVYVKDFGKEHGYKIIFGTVSGGNILYGAEGADITAEFIEFVNSK
ncbi:MAG: OmpH family outer membrane protein [Bacteroidetes bacterium]|nr:OmpH family outer membrane protein [Bacteroidota bacterium]